MRALIPVIVAFAFLHVAGAASQQPAAPILSVRTDVVTLLVTVVDRAGLPVAGLRPEQFRIYDNGAPQAVQFFAGTGGSATLGLVMDSSGSMRGHREQAAAAADAFAAMRATGDECFALFFNELVWPGVPAGGGFAEDAARLGERLLSVPPQGMTALYDAVDRALVQVQQGTRERRALILVSDGGDNASAERFEAVAERLRRSGVVVFSVTFFDPDNRDARPAVLKTLTHESGGRALVARTPADVTRAFEQIAGELRSAYAIGFSPAETSRAGYRSIRVEVEAGPHVQLAARTRTGYWAGPSTLER